MTTVKKIMAKNRSLVALLLVGWLLLCALMPLLMVDTDLDVGMGREEASLIHSHHAISNRAISNDGMASHSVANNADLMTMGNTAGVDQHCCDVLDGDVLVTPNQLADLFTDLLLLAAVCSFFLLWGRAIKRTNTYFYFFIPPFGPPLHQRLCVWLD